MGDETKQKRRRRDKVIVFKLKVKFSLNKSNNQAKTNEGKKTNKK